MWLTTFRSPLPRHARAHRTIVFSVSGGRFFRFGAARCFSSSRASDPRRGRPRVPRRSATSIVAPQVSWPLGAGDRPGVEARRPRPGPPAVAVGPLQHLLGGGDRRGQAVADVPTLREQAGDGRPARQAATAVVQGILHGPGRSRPGPLVFSRRGRWASGGGNRMAAGLQLGTVVAPIVFRARCERLCGAARAGGYDARVRNHTGSRRIAMSLKGYTGSAAARIFDEGARHDPANHRSDDDGRHCNCRRRPAWRERPAVPFHLARPGRHATAGTDPRRPSRPRVGAVDAGAGADGRRGRSGGWRCRPSSGGGQSPRWPGRWCGAAASVCPAEFPDPSMQFHEYITLREISSRNSATTLRHDAMPRR